MNGALTAGPPPFGDGGGPVALSTPVRRAAAASALGTG